MKTRLISSSSSHDRSRAPVLLVACADARLLPERLAHRGVVGLRSIGGGRNAGLLAVRILGAGDRTLVKRVLRFQSRLAADSRARNEKLQSEAGQFKPH